MVRLGLSLGVTSSSTRPDAKSGETPSRIGLSGPPEDLFRKVHIFSGQGQSLLCVGLLTAQLPREDQEVRDSE